MILSNSQAPDIFELEKKTKTWQSYVSINIAWKFQFKLNCIL